MKKKLSRMFALLGLSVISVFGPGCVVVVAGGCDWSQSPAVWAEETVQIPLETVGLSAMDVRTHNGDVDFAGNPGAVPAGIVAQKRAGSSSMDDAREALAAIEIVSERAGGEHRLSWRWKGEKRSRWVGGVAFSIQGPSNLALTVETHNGEVKAGGVVGNVKVLTHNGAVIVDSREGSLEAVTHNGSVSATYGGPNIKLETHNGEVKADLRQSGSVRGEISTHNGAIEVQVGSVTAANVVAETDNGRVTSQAPITVSASSRTRLEGQLGPGGEKLELTTHNGSIQIKAG